MNICHVAAEYAPLIKIGGLADVTFGLSHQLAKLGHKVEIILPNYTLLNKTPLQGLHILKQEFHKHRLWQGTIGTITITLIEPLENDYFTRNNVYGEKDDVVRFGSFSLIAHLYLLEKSTPPIVHLHDWHTALLALLNNQANYPTLYTIHNLSYMGECDENVFKTLNIPLESTLSIKAGENYNLMKAGILYADHVTTVSTSYAYEIMYTELGGVLQETLYNHREKITGIINGIDQEFWNPATDPLLPYNFSLQEMKNKTRIKRYVEKRFHLDTKKDFLACSITRLVPQKGPALILEAIQEVLKLGGTYIVLGSSFDPLIEAQFLEIKKNFAGTHSFHLELTYDETLAHLIFAASDLFVMPSLFEPCGLTQLIALRYGTPPLVRETGGLKDTVFENKNGFTFSEISGEAIRASVRRAFLLAQENPLHWNRLIKEGMEEDHSWQKSAESYLALYSRLGLILRCN